MAKTEKSQRKTRQARGKTCSSKAQLSVSSALARLASKSWQPLLKEFVTKHKAWHDLVYGRDPVLWLPEVVLDVLTPLSPTPERRNRAILTVEEADTENTFRKMCQSFSPSVIGVWQSIPVRYELLGIDNSSSVMEEFWAQLQSLEQDRLIATKKAENTRHQQLAYAGWLTFFSNDYREELKSLRRIWKSLEDQPSFPLLANTGDQLPQSLEKLPDEAIPLPPETADFLDKATMFMRKWNLSRLVTWELPFPQGPLEQILLGLARHVLGPNEFGSIFPSYFDIPSNQDVRAEIREGQEANAKASGLGKDFPLTDLSARADTSSKWENAFRLWLIERTAFQRYTGRYGLASRLVSAFSQLIGCSSERVMVIRRIYRRFVSTFLT